jgi:hypothetical protein
MELDASLKVLGFIGAAIAGSLGTWKVLDELLRKGKTSLREDYRFARDFLSECAAGAMHPMLAEMGFQALAGDSKISADEVRHLLTLQNSRSAIREYIAAKQVLDFFSTAPSAKITFRKKYESASWRRALKYWYAGVYFLTYSLSFAPLLLISMKLLSAPTGLALFGLSSVMFLPIAFLSAKAGGRLTRAERLVAWQTSRSSLTK